MYTRIARQRCPAAAGRLSESPIQRDHSTNLQTIENLCPFDAGPLRRQTSPPAQHRIRGGGEGFSSFLGFCHLCIPRDGIKTRQRTYVDVHRYRLLFSVCNYFNTHIIFSGGIHSYPRITINSLDRDRAPAHTHTIAIAQDIRSGSCFPLHSPPPRLFSTGISMGKKLCALHALVAMPYTYVT